VKDIERLDPDIESLLGRERVEAAVPPAAAARIRRQIDSSIGAAVGAHHPSGGPASGAARNIRPPSWRTLLPLATLVAGGVIGAAIRSTLAPPVVYVDRPLKVAPSAARVQDPSPVIPPTDRLPEIAHERVVQAPSTTPHPRVLESEAQQLAQERRAVDAARAALTAGDTSRALAVLDEHERAFPRGILREEREALAVRALARAGRGAEAKARAAVFHTQFPQSLFASGVDTELERIP
jgi:hypothetical protein